MTRPSTTLMPPAKQDVDARVKPGHDERAITARLISSFGHTMRLRIAHTTTYHYAPPATGVIQILRMTPGSHDGQYVVNWQIDVSTDSRLDMHEDAFGNITHVLTQGPVEDLTISVEGLIETHD